MKKLSYILMVGLAFTVLQVATVAAQTGAPGAPMCDSNPACDPVSGTCCDQCDANPACVMGDPNAIPCCGPVDGPPGSHDGPPGSHDGPPGQHDGPPGGQHDGPPGQHDGPPIDPRSGQPFTKADEDKFQKYADECEATQGLISQGSKDELIAEGFTAIMVDDLCKNGPQDAPPAP